VCSGEPWPLHRVVWPPWWRALLLGLPDKIQALAAMDSCFGLVRPHQHNTANTWAQIPWSCPWLLTLGLTIFSGRLRGNVRHQRGHSVPFSGYSLPEHICAVFWLCHYQPHPTSLTLHSCCYTYARRHFGALTCANVISKMLYSGGSWTQGIKLDIYILIVDCR